MKVTLISYTPDPDRLTATAAKVCYSSKKPPDIYKDLTDDQINKTVDHIVGADHGTPQEHAFFTFSVSDISLAAVQQLLRYRLINVNQMSMRYVNVEENDVVVPPDILKTKDDKGVLLNSSGLREPTPYEVYMQCAEATRNAYKFFLSKGIKKESARYGLIIGTKTQLIFTANAFEIKHILGQRLCTRAMPEINALAAVIQQIVKRVAPRLFANAGPMCERLGYCPEDSMSCGKKPTIQELLNHYNKDN